jgi:hypothetical protein
MFASLPKILDKHFVIGFFFPALLALFASSYAFPGWVILSPLHKLAASEKSLADITYILLSVWMLSVLLVAANYSQYRALEGYLPPIRWISVLRWWHRRKFLELKEQYDILWREWQNAVDAGEKFLPDKQRTISKLQAHILAKYPASLDDEASIQEILPTSFGNAIRAFEVYPAKVYGVDTIPIWTRLFSVVPKDFMLLIDDARCQVDLFVNLAYLSTIISFLALAYAIKSAFTLGGQTGHFVIVAICGFAVAHLAYRWATTRVILWGELVKSAFDCYLPALIKQFGYSTSLRENHRREFWSDINEMVLYRQPVPAGRWPIITPDGPPGDSPGPVAAENGQTEAAEGGDSPGPVAAENGQTAAVEGVESDGGDKTARAA